MLGLHLVWSLWLNVTMDTGLFEVSSLRDRKIKCVLLMCYAEEISSTIDTLVREYRDGYIALDNHGRPFSPRTTDQRRVADRLILSDLRILKHEYKSIMNVHDAEDLSYEAFCC